MNARTPSETDRVRSIWQEFAPRYDRQVRFFERILFEGGREWLASRARGDVLEIAVGTGRNFRFYGPDVRLTGIDITPATLEIARGRARAVGRDIDIREGDAQALEFPDESFDTVVSSLALCSIPDPDRAVAEAKRVLRRGGLFLALEHVRSPGTIVRAVQRLLDPLSVRFQADHLVREPLDPLERHGFQIVELQRLKWGIVERVAATKPVAPQG